MILIEINSKRVAELKKLREEIKYKQREINLSTAPLLTDYSLLPGIFNIFQKYFHDRGVTDVVGNVYYRKKFLFVALCLFSPRSLHGGKLHIGLRNTLAEILKMKSTPVSDNCQNLIIYYSSYRDFKKDTDAIIAEVLKEYRGYIKKQHNSFMSSVKIC